LDLRRGVRESTGRDDDRPVRYPGFEAGVNLRDYNGMRGEPSIEDDTHRCVMWVADLGDVDECAYCGQPKANHDDRAINGPHADPRKWRSDAEWQAILAPQVGTRPLLSE
jgi:hypothetical protein